MRTGTSTVIDLSACTGFSILFMVSYLQSDISWTTHRLQDNLRQADL
jgi:hypothetical protein